MSAPRSSSGRVTTIATASRPTLTLALTTAMAMAMTACTATPTSVVELPPPATFAADAIAPTMPAMPAMPTADAPAAGGDAAASVAALQSALAARNYDALQAMMGDAFVLGLYRSEGMTLDPAAARTALETQHLPPADHAVDATDDRTAFPAIDPPLEAMFDPALIVNALLFSRGWGADGRGEAVLVLAERADGTVYWHGMVLAPSGFGGATGDAAGSGSGDGRDVSAAAGGPVSGDGFAVDAPAGWTATESGGGVILTSFAMDTAGHGGLGAGQTKIDVLELVADPAPTTLAAAIAEATRGIEVEEGGIDSPVAPFRTASGLSGLWYHHDLAVIDLGVAFVVASCYGEDCGAGGVFDAVVASVRAE